MLIIGHRGASEIAPENTLKSIRMALESEVDMIEIDVSICKSGEAVVMHDDRVETTTDGYGYIEDMTLNEIKKLDAGEGEQVPTLQEVIDLIDGRCPLNIEIKGSGSSRVVSRMLEAEVMDKGRCWDNFLVSSFDHFELSRFKRMRKEVRTSPIISCLPLNMASIAENMGAWSLNLSKETINKAIVDDAHAKGLKALVFTINVPEELAKMEKIGVDGIFTNNRFRVLGLK